MVNLSTEVFCHVRLIPVQQYGQIIVYNAGNERYYYRQYKAEVSDNIMEENSFNPYFIKSELLNF